MDAKNVGLRWVAYFSSARSHLAGAGFAFARAAMDERGGKGVGNFPAFPATDTFECGVRNAELGAGFSAEVLAHGLGI
jgi:hypothetical protein